MGQCVEIELRVYFGVFSVFSSAPQHPTHPTASFTGPIAVVGSCPAVPVLCPCRKDQNVLSPVNCWNLLLNQVKRESRDHTTLSDIYLNNIIPRFVQVSEDSGRLFKKVTECSSTELHFGSSKTPLHLSLVVDPLIGVLFLFVLDSPLIFSGIFPSVAG